MTYADAMKIRTEFYEDQNHTADEEFMFTEALSTLIEATQEPKYMTELAWFYCDRKRFDMEQKYLEMAADCGYGPAYEELGYMYFHGQNGEKDYEKAFRCFTKGSEKDRYGNEGSLWCYHKLADMYRFGCYVEKDEDRYREMIEDAYEKVKNPKYLNEPYPEILYRLAGIRADQGRTEEAIDLLRRARGFMAERLSHDAFWGHLEVMGRIIRLLHRLSPEEMPGSDFYDLFYMTEEPGQYVLMPFGFEDREIVLDVTGEGEERVLSCDGRCYRDFADFCSKMSVNGRKITELYDEYFSPYKIDPDDERED